MRLLKYILLIYFGYWLYTKVSLGEFWRYLFGIFYGEAALVYALLGDNHEKT